MKLVPHINFPICNAKTLKLNISKLLRTQIEPYISKGTILQVIDSSKFIIPNYIEIRLFRMHVNCYRNK